VKERMANMTNPKLRILETAEELFAAKGFDGVTVRDIAEHAQVNVAMINYYFGNKDDLYLGIVESYLEAINREMEKVLAQETDPCLRLKLFIESYVNFLFSKAKTAQLVLRSEFQDNANIDRFVSNYFAKNQIKVEDTITEGIKAGYFIPVDPKLTAVSLMGMMLWFFAGAPIFIRIPGMEDYLGRYKDQFAQHTWELLTKGICSPESPQFR
jgi:Transcriptional regulator